MLLRGGRRGPLRRYPQPREVDPIEPERGPEKGPPRGPAGPEEETYNVYFPMCIENIPDQPNKVTIIDEIANMDELYPYVFSGEGRTGKYIQIIVNPENKYYCLSQMELLKIKYIQYGIYFIQQKKKP